MKEKLAQVNSWIKTKGKKIVVTLSLLSATLLSLLVFAFLFVLWKYPVDRYKPQVEEWLSQHTGFEEVRVQAMQWQIHPLQLSLGLSFEGVELRGSNSIDQVNLDHAGLHFRLLRLAFGSLAVDLELHKSRVQWTAEDNSSDKANAIVSSSDAKLPSWMRRLQLNVRTESLVFVLPEGQELLAEAEMKLSGLPGTFSFEGSVHGSKPIHFGGGTWKGLTSFSGEGFFQVSDGRVVGADCSKLEVDFSKVEFEGPYAIHKIDTQNLVLQSRLQLFLNENGVFRGWELSQGDLRYLGYSFRLQAQGDRSGMFSGKVEFPLGEVSNFQIPVHGITALGFDGRMEVAGEVLHSPREGYSGQWRVYLNNFRVPASTLKPWFNPDRSDGEVVASLVTEGTFEKNRVVSPRTEIQLKATDAQLETADGSFVKPKGDQLDWMLKARIDNNELKVSSLRMQFHTLLLEAAAELGSFSSFVDGEETPMTANVVTNRVSLADWANYFPLFRKIPLEGFFQVSVSAEGTTVRSEKWLDRIRWRVDRLALNRFRGAMDPSALGQVGVKTQDLQMRGPFQFNFLFQGRGIGPVIHRGALSINGDLSDLAISKKDRLLKASGVPLQADVLAEQTRTQLKVKRGEIRFHDLDLDFSGTLSRSASRSTLNVKMKKPVRLSTWKPYLDSFDQEDNSLDGTLTWNGALNFDSKSALEGDLDLRQVGLDGSLELKNFQGRPRFLPARVSNLDARITFGSEGIAVSTLRSNLGDQVLMGSGFATPVLSSKRPVYFADFLFAKTWNVSGTLSLSEFRSDQLFFGRNDAALDGTSADGVLRGSLQSWLNAGAKHSSRIQLRVLAPKWQIGTLEGTDLLAIATWDRDAWVLSPLSARHAGAKWTGSASWNFEPFVFNKSKPTFSGTLRTEALDLRLASSAIGELNLGSLQPSGQIEGELTFAAEGFDPSELQQSQKHRFVGRVSKLNWLPQQDHENALKDVLRMPVYGDLFLTRMQPKRCVSGDLSGAVELESQAGLKSSWSFVEAQQNDDNSSLVWSGLRNASTAPWNVMLSWKPTEGCFSEDLMACVRERAPDGFVLSRIVDSDKSSWKPAGIWEQLGACLQSNIASMANASLQTTTQKNFGDKKVEQRVRRGLGGSSQNSN